MKRKKRKAAKQQGKKRARKRTAPKRAGRKKAASRKPAKKAAKKKAAKKKGAKKKATKKKAAKKKAAKKKPKGPRHRSVSIKASIASIHDRHVAKSRSDQLVWKSKDDDYTVTFLDGWPFVEGADVAPRTIDVPALGKSGSFTVDESVTARDYEYVIEPAAPHQDRRPNPVVTVEE